MNTFPETRIAAIALCAMSSAFVAGCSDGSEISAVEIDAPPSARIGNVATANLLPAGNSRISGTAVFAEVDHGLRVEATVSGLPSGEHSFRLDENGDCAVHFPSDSAGQGPAADLGNLTASADGAVHIVREYPELSLIGESGVVGKAVVVQSGSDDVASEQSADSGQRMACGTVEWGSEDLEPL